MIVSPPPGSIFTTGSGNEVLVIWTRTALAHTYTLEVATDPNFTQPIPGSPFVVADPLFEQQFIRPDPTRYYLAFALDTTTAGAYSTGHVDFLDTTVHVYCPATSAVTCSDTDMAGKHRISDADVRWSAGARSGLENQHNQRGGAWW